MNLRLFAVTLLLVSGLTAFDAGHTFAADKEIPTRFDDIYHGKVDLRKNSKPSLVSPKQYNDTYRHTQWYANYYNVEAIHEQLPKQNRIKVAVIDTGIRSDHFDFNGVTYRLMKDLSNRPELKASDSHCAKFDMCKHGTAVAGIIAASTNNQSGISGLSKNIELLDYAVLTGSSSDMADAIRHAADSGARVINISGGYDSVDVEYVRNSVEYAEKKNSIIVAAAGNKGEGRFLRPNGTSPVEYPAAYPTVIGVGSITSDEQRSYFSSIGEMVDIAAPGSNMATLDLPNGDRGQAAVWFQARRLQHLS